jgi:ATP-binding cassette subfamily B protein
MMLGMVSGMLIENFLTPVVVVIGMFFIDWRMAVLLMIILPLAIPLYRRKRKSGFHERTEMAKANSALESDIIEYIQGLPVLRATNQTGKNAKRLHEGIINVRDLQRSSNWSTIINLVMADMLILFALIMIAVLGSIWVGNGTMSIAAIAALLVIVSRRIV